MTPLHLMNIKRVAYGIHEVRPAGPCAVPAPAGVVGGVPSGDTGDEQLMAVVNEVLQLLKQKGEF